MSNMDYWQTLGIEPTKDEEEIRRAYLKQLPNFHPEDDPEGFKRLRTAYEDALTYTKENEDDVEVDNSESGLIVGELRQIINDFPRRLNPEEWRSVLDREECSGIDIQSQIGEKLLVALMDSYYLPQKVWKLLNSYFNWIEMEAALKENFPPLYVNYVINGIKYEEIIRCDFFDLSNPDANYSDFMNKYYALNEALGEGDFEKAESMINENKDPLFNHLDYRILLAYYHNNKEEKEQAENHINRLLEEYPDDVRVAYAAGNIFLRNDNPEKAMEFFEIVASKDSPHNNSAKVGIARCYFEMEEYEIAKEKCLEMLVDYYFDDYVSAMFHASSEKLIPIYEEALKDSPGDQDFIYKLASCYFNEAEFEKCNDLIKDVIPEEKYIAKHYELIFDILVEMNDYGDNIPDDVMQYLIDWEKYETNRKRLRYLPQKYHAIGMLDEALKKADVYLLEFPGDPEICMVKARIFRSKQMNAESHKVITDGLKTESMHPGLLSEQAHLLLDEGDIGGAVNCAETALLSFPYLIDMHEMIVKAYYDAGQFNQVLDLAKDVENFNGESKIISMYKAAASVTLDIDAEEAEKTLREMLKDDASNTLLLDKLGDYYTNKKMPEEGLEVYNKLIELSENPYYYLSRGWIYANNRKHFGEQARLLAIKDYNKALEVDEEYAPAYYQLGIMSYEVDDLDKAIEYFEKANEHDSIRHSYIYLVKSYSEKGDIANAIKAADKGIGIFEKREDEESIRSLNEEKLEAYYKSNLYKEGLKLEKTVLDEDGKTENAEVYHTLANCHFENYEDDIAERYFEKALELEPKNERFLRNYGHFKIIALKDPNAAIKLYQKALEAFPFYRTHVLMGKAYLLVGQSSLAKQHFKEALKILKDSLKNNTIPCVDYYIGECYAGLGKRKKAEKYLYKSLSEAGDYIACHTHYCYESAFLLAELFRLSGNMKIAREFYKKVIDLVPDREYAEARSLYE